MSTPTPIPAATPRLDPVRTRADPELVAGCLAEEAAGRAGPATAQLRELLTGLVDRHVDRRPGRRHPVQPRRAGRARGAAPHAAGVPHPGRARRSGRGRHPAARGTRPRPAARRGPDRPLLRLPGRRQPAHRRAARPGPGPGLVRAVLPAAGAGRRRAAAGARRGRARPARRGHPGGAGRRVPLRPAAGRRPATGCCCGPGSGGGRPPSEKFRRRMRTYWSSLGTRTPQSGPNSSLGSWPGPEIKGQKRPPLSGQDRQQRQG